MINEYQHSYPQNFNSLYTLYGLISHTDLSNINWDMKNQMKENVENDENNENYCTFDPIISMMIQLLSIASDISVLLIDIHINWI